MGKFSTVLGLKVSVDIFKTGFKYFELFFCIVGFFSQYNGCGPV